MVGPTFFELYVTSVEKDRNFLKIWGQKDKASATTVERLIAQHSQAFAQNVGVPSAQSLQIGQTCCAPYRDGDYYRAIINAVDISSLFVRVTFPDYGNSDVLPIAVLRFPKDAEALYNIAPQASSFILSEVTGNWDERTLHEIITEIGYEEHKCVVVSSISVPGAPSDVHLLKLYFKDRDYAEVLCAKGFAAPLAHNQFEVFFKCSSQQSYPSFVPPYPNQMMNINQNPYWPKMTPNQIMPSFHGYPSPMTSNPYQSPYLNPVSNLNPPGLEQGFRIPCPKSSQRSVKEPEVELAHESEYQVIPALVEDFSNFFVNLKSDENALLDLMSDINNENFNPVVLKPPILPGTHCLGRYSGDGSLCRAVVLGLEGDLAKVFYIDYGTLEYLKFDSIYELPKHLASVKPMAIQCSLSGLREVAPTDEMKEIFKEVFKPERDARMIVRAPKEGETPLKIYCDLYLNDTNVTEVVRLELLKKRSKPKLRPMNVVDVGSKEQVVVSYVHSVNHFFVQILSKSPELEDMMEKLNRFCQTKADKFLQSEICQGALCCALFLSDNRWYRATIIDIPGDDTVTVMYVDYGNEDSVSPHNLRVLDSRFTSLRTQAVLCQLHGHEDKVSETDNRFEELCLDTEVTMEVIQTAKSKREKSHTVVKLFNSAGQNISDLLAPPKPISNGHSKPYQAPRPEHTSPKFIEQSQSKSIDKYGKEQRGPIEQRSDLTQAFKHDTSNERLRSRHNDYEESDRQSSQYGRSNEGRDRNRPARNNDENRFRSDDRFWKDDYSKGRPKECDWGSTSGDRWGHCDRTEVDHGEEKVPSVRKSERVMRVVSEVSRESHQRSTKVDEEWGEDNASPILKLKMLSPALGSTMPIYLVYFNNPSDFYVQRRDSDLSDLMNRIEEEYRSGGEALPASQVREGTVCVAKYTEDDTWYRAIIKNVKNNSVEVFFSDYGNLQFVDKGELKKLKSEMTSVEGQAIHCSLMGTNSVWSDDDIALFGDLSSSECLDATFVEASDSLYQVILKDGGSIINERFGATKESLLSPTTVVTSIPSAYLPPGSCQVEVVWFVNPSQFFVQVKPSSDFQKLMQKMQVHYKGKAPLSTADVGQMVVVRFNEDNTFYRAKVKILKGRKFGVQYVDYGNKSLVDEVFGLEHQFAKLPCQGILCSLKGVLPIEEAWPKNSPEISEFFNGDMLCTFLECQNVGNNVQHIISLSLDGVDVAQQLILNAFAKSDEPPTIEEAVEDKLEEDVCLDLLVGQLIPAVLTTFVDNKVFVNLEPDRVMKLQQELQDIAQNPEKLLQLPPDDLKTSQLCVVQSVQSSMLKRAKIINSASTAGILVQCLDDGTVEEVEISSVFVLPEELASVPLLAVECIIASTENQNDIETGLKALIDQNINLMVQQVIDGRLHVNLLSATLQPFPFMQCEDLSTPIRPMVVLYRRMQMCVSYASGAAVWLQRACDTDAIAQMLDDLFTSLEDKEMTSCEWQKNAVCAAKSEDGNWYRGILEEVTDSTANVYFVDYGNSEVVPKENLRKLPEEFWYQPTFALKASLPLLGVDDTLGDAIMSLAEDKVFIAVLEKVEQSWFVELFEKEEQLSKKVILKGQAYSMENNPLTKYILKPVAKSKLSPGATTSVYVSCVTSSSEIYVQVVDCYEKLENMQSDLQTLAVCMKSFETSPEIGAKCMALYEDEMWYRGKVLPDGKIHFIDYGNVASVEFSNLKQLPPAVSQVEDFAVRCSLVAPKALKWSSSVSSRLEELLLEAQNITAKVLSTSSNGLLIDLFLGDKSVAEMLVHEGCVENNLLKPVFVSYINSPEDFWVSENDSVEILENMDLESGDDVRDVKAGTLCAALFDDDGAWYRARIETVLENGYNVKFVDYGNSAVSSQLKTLSPELLTLPPLAKHCCLPCDGHKWSDASLARFTQLADDGNKVFTMSVLAEGDPATISLCLDGTAIHEELISLCSSETVASEIENPVTPLKAFVVFVNSPSDFCIQLLKDSDALHIIEEALLGAEDFDDLMDITPGTLCAAKFCEDDSWYRACILERNEDACKVVFIDYGNTSLCKELKSLPEALQGPALSKRCCFPHIESSSMWTDSAVDKFREMCNPEVEFEVEMFGTEEPLITNLISNGKSVILELADLSGVDRTSVELAISTLRNSLTEELSKGSRIVLEAVQNQVIENVNETTSTPDAVESTNFVSSSISGVQESMTSVSNDEAKDIFIEPKIIRNDISECEDTVTVHDTVEATLEDGQVTTNDNQAEIPTEPNLTPEACETSSTVFKSDLGEATSVTNDCKAEISGKSDPISEHFEDSTDPKPDSAAITNDDVTEIPSETDNVSLVLCEDSSTDPKPDCGQFVSVANESELGTPAGSSNVISELCEDSPDPKHDHVETGSLTSDDDAEAATASDILTLETCEDSSSDPKPACLTDENILEIPSDSHNVISELCEDSPDPKHDSVETGSLTYDNVAEVATAPGNLILETCEDSSSDPKPECLTDENILEIPSDTHNVISELCEDSPDPKHDSVETGSLTYDNVAEVATASDNLILETCEDSSPDPKPACSTDENIPEIPLDSHNVISELCEDRPDPKHDSVETGSLTNESVAEIASASDNLILETCEDSSSDPKPACLTDENIPEIPSDSHNVISELCEDSPDPKLDSVNDNVAEIASESDDVISEFCEDSITKSDDKTAFLIDENVTKIRAESVNVIAESCGDSPSPKPHSGETVSSVKDFVADAPIESDNVILKPCGDSSGPEPDGGEVVADKCTSVTNIPQHSIELELLGQDSGLSRPPLLQRVEGGEVYFTFSECDHSSNIEIISNDVEEEDISIVKTELIASVMLAEADKISEDLVKGNQSSKA